MSQAFIGLGSNLGDRIDNLRRALEGIAALERTHVLAVSSVVESQPWGVTDQPNFANAVARIDTDIPADRLLGLLKELESSLGRQPGPRNSARVIDLDILLYGDDEWVTPELRIPHPRMAEREFVIAPLLEIAPHITWPDGSPITREHATEGRVTRVLGSVPGFEDVTPQLGGWRDAGQSGGPNDPWEPVSSGRFGPGTSASFATQLLFEAFVLEQAGIPVGWDPMPPDEEYNPWMLPRTYRLLVPPGEARRARELLADVRSATPEAADDEG